MSRTAPHHGTVCSVPTNAVGNARSAADDLSATNAHVGPPGDPPQAARSVKEMPLYGIWRGIIDRCCNPNAAAYRLYGARGIRVCDEWLQSYDAFERDMGERPSLDHTIDRIDNDGDYEIENCRWATWLEQGRNRSETVVLEHHGRTMSLGDWSDFLGIPSAVLRRRYVAGWSPRSIIETPYAPPGTAPDASRPTERQAEILAWIIKFLDANGFPPTLRQIGAAFAIRSTNGINDHLRALERKGCIERSQAYARGIAVTPHGRAVVGLSRRCPHCQLGLD